VLAPLAALLVEGWPALVGTLMVQESGLWLARRFTDACQRGFATRLFITAYGLRMLIALPMHYIAKLGDGNGAVYRDDYTNDLVAEWLVRIARGVGDTSIFAGHQYLLGSIYTYFLAGVYAVFGYTPLLPKVVNIGLAGLCAVLTFDIARRVFSVRAATLAALGTAFLPSLIVWSIATLKETLVLFIALVALRLVQLLTGVARRDPRLPTALVLLFGVVLLLLDLRSTVAAIVVGLLALIVIARSHLRLPRWQVGLLSLAIAGLLLGGLVVVRERTSSRPLTATFEDIALQIRHRRAQEAAGAGSQLRPETDVFQPNGRPAAEAASDSEPFSFTADVLDPLGYALLSPAPWQAQSLTEVGASAEMPVWYVLLIASLFGVQALPRSSDTGQRLFVVCLVVYGVANWLILAAVEGNLGNLLRHRLMLDTTLLILGGAGLEWLWMRSSELQLLTGSRQPILSHEDVGK
jgi:4-amino-4-deoxy-L-arabinose transferase-like glycosyltransferase